MSVSDDFAVSPIVCEPCVSGDVCDLNEEGEQARTMNVGHKPSVEEVNMHNLTHIPFRSWCPFCVAYCFLRTAMTKITQNMFLFTIVLLTPF